jgi:HEAT repeat protein
VAEDRSELIRVAVALGPIMADALSTGLTRATEAAEEHVRDRLMDALVALGPAALDSVRVMLDDARWPIVRNGVQLLPDVGGRLSAEDLARASAHPDARVRREAITGLVRVAAPESGPIVLDRLDDPDPEVRAAAARALGVMKIEGAGTALIRRLQLEADPVVELAIVGALGGAGHEAAVPELERRASRGMFSRRPSTLRIAALQALWSVGTPPARAVVMRAMDDRDPEVQGAIRALLGGR